VVSLALQAVADATAAVFVGDRRAGSAVLVDGRHLLTAAHVLRSRNESGHIALVDEVELVFPAVAAAVGDSEPRTSARRIFPLDSAEPSIDAAVLDVGDAPPAWLPRPVELFVGQRWPAQVSVYGFPLSERALRGVWRAFDTSGPAAGGTVQLDWTRTVGTLRGQSGGPVVNPTGVLLGVLIEGSEKGRFDRFLPLSLLRRNWPGLPHPWLLLGLEARSHFTRRASGQGSRTRGGNLFRGRRVALAAVREWMTRQEAPGQVLVVTGQPGAGKSALVARSALTLEAERRAPGLAFHARAATLADFLAAVADLLGVERADSPADLIEGLKVLPDGLFLIILDALDEAASANDRRQIAETLRQLAAWPGLRVAVATRPLVAGNPYAPSGLLAALGVSSPESQNLVDLDSDRYFDSEGLEAFAAALLAQEGAEHPGPPGGAWVSYRAATDVRDLLAHVVAVRAARNYLVAAMAAVPLSEKDVVVDPTAHDFDPRSIPSEVGEALDKYLETLPDRDQVQTRGLLTALAYARGEGIDDKTWLRFATALGYSASVVDLDLLRGFTTADYLVETVHENGGRVTRLFHQALTDELLVDRPRSSDEHALFEALVPEPISGGWAAASAYARVYAADHAAACDELPNLLDDPHYLAVAEFSRLLPLLSPPEEFGPIAAVLGQVGLRAGSLPPPRRARLLALTAAHLGLPQIQERLAAACSEGFAPQWAHALGAAHRELAGHTGEVNAVALGRIGAREVIVSGSDDLTVRIWDARTGQPLGVPLAGHTGGVKTVALGRIGEREIIVSGGGEGTVRIWDADNRQPLGAPLIGHRGPVNAVVLGRVGEREVIVSGSDDSTVRIWDASSGESLGAPLAGHSLVYAVALGRLEGREVIVSGGYDGRVRIWDAGSGESLVAALTRYSDGVHAVALGRIGEREVIVSGAGDGKVRIGDTGNRQQLGPPLTGHAGEVNSVALGRIGEHEVVVSGGDDGTVRIWEAGSRRPLGSPLTGHTGEVNAVALGRIGERGVIVSGGADGMVRTWEAGSSQAVGAPQIGHSSVVNTVALGRIGEREVIVSGGWDNTLRIWDAGSGEPLGAPLTGHTDVVDAVALGRIGEQEVIVSGGRDNTVRIWDAGSGQPLGPPITAHSRWVNAVALGRIGEREVIVSGGDDGMVRMWEAASRQPLRPLVTGHGGEVNAVALGRIREQEVIVAGDWKGTLRIWDAGSGEPLGAPLTGHTDSVSAVALGRIGEREVIVSGGHDGTVRVWEVRNRAREVVVSASADRMERIWEISAGWREVIKPGSVGGRVRMWAAGSGQPLGAPVTAHTLVPHSSGVNAVALGRIAEQEVIVSGGDDGMVRIWEAGSGQPLGAPLTGHSRGVNAVALGRIGKREVIVSGAWDSTVRIWEAGSRRPLGAALTTDGLTAVALGHIGETEVIVTASYDGTVRIWEARTRQPLGAPLKGHRSAVMAVAMGRIGERDVIVAAGFGGRVRIWEASSSRRHGVPLTGHRGGVAAVALGRIGDQEVVVTGGYDNTVRIWDARTTQPLGTPLTGHSSVVNTVALGRIGEREVIVSGAWDGTVQIWDAGSGRHLGAAPSGLGAGPFFDHGKVQAVALGQIRQRDVIVSAGSDDTIRIWDAGSGQPLGAPVTGHTGPVSSVAVGRIEELELTVSGGADLTVRIWDANGRVVRVLDVLGQVAAIGLSPSTLCVATGPAICVFGLSLGRHSAGA
jgi:WD40 repeat protein